MMAACLRCRDGRQIKSVGLVASRSVWYLQAGLCFIDSAAPCFQPARGVPSAGSQSRSNNRHHSGGSASSITAEQGQNHSTPDAGLSNAKKRAGARRRVCFARGTLPCHGMCRWLIPPPADLLGCGAGGRGPGLHRDDETQRAHDRRGIEVACTCFRRLGSTRGWRLEQGPNSRPQRAALLRWPATPPSPLPPDAPGAPALPARLRGRWQRH